MLVLSRGKNDRIVFPSLGISIEVTKVNGSRASLGIEAPKHIRVLRHELMDGETAEEFAGFGSDSGLDEAKRIQHEHRNKINRAALRLQLAAKMLSRGDNDTALANMLAGIAELNTINEASPSAAMKTGQEMTLAEAKATFTCDANEDSHRVLLVDDDVNERALMSSYLRRCGLTVDEAGDGLQALYTLSKTKQPDVILMDMNMPNLDGKGTIERIRQFSVNPTIPVFAVTAEPMEDTGITISDEGVTGWFRKPVQVDEIVDAIELCVAAQ